MTTNRFYQGLNLSYLMFNIASKNEIFIRKYKNNFSIESFKGFFSFIEFKKDIKYLDEFFILQINSIFKQEYENKNIFNIQILKELIVQSDILKDSEVSQLITADKIDAMLKASELWYKKLNKIDIETKDINLEAKNAMSQSLIQLFTFNKNKAYKELVANIKEIYKKDDETDDETDEKEVVNNESLVDINFTALISEKNARAIEQYLKEYLRKLQKNQICFNECMKSIGMEQEVDNTKYLTSEQVKAHNGLFDFILKLIQYFIESFETNDNTVSIFSAKNKDAITESLWDIINTSKEIDENIMQSSTAYMERFFNEPYHEILGDALRNGLNNQLNNFSNDVTTHLKNSYQLHALAPSLINVTYLFFKNFPKDLNSKTLPRIIEVITSIIEPSLKNKYTDLISIAKKHMQYSIRKFMFDISHNRYSDIDARDYCGKILDLIEKTNDNIEATLFNTRFALVETVLKICDLDFRKTNELFAEIVDKIDEIVLNVDKTCRQQFQSDSFKLLSQEINLAIQANYLDSYQAIQSMLVTHNEFINNSFLQKIKQQAKFVMACTPIKVLVGEYKNGDKVYGANFLFEIILNLEMNQIITPIATKYEEEGGKILKLRIAGYGSTNTVNFSSFAVYQTLLEIQRNKPNRAILKILATDFNYDKDPSKSYFALKITKWRDALNSFIYKDTDLGTDDDIHLALGARYFLHYDGNITHDSSCVDMNLLRQMLDYKCKLQQNPMKFILESDYLCKEREKRHDFIEKAPPKPLIERLDEADKDISSNETICKVIRNNYITPKLNEIITLLKTGDRVVSEFIKQRVDIIRFEGNRLGDLISDGRCRALYLEILTEALIKQGLVIDSETDMVIKLPAANSSLRPGK